MKTRATILFALSALLIIGILWSVAKKPVTDENNNPPQDTDIAENDKIKIFSPLPNGVITSPVGVRGEARGTWYFEASFPIRLEDANGKVLVQTYTMAQGEWMTENFVPFELILSFDTPETDKGTLIFEKDNPSGLPEHAEELRMPVRFR